MTTNANQTLALQNGKDSQPIKAGQLNKFKAKAGEHYRIVKRKGEEEQLLDDVIAKKAGDDLQLSYADGTQVTLENYYGECASATACDLTLPGQGPDGYSLNSGSPGSATLGSDGSSVLYAHGSHDALIAMVQGNSALLSSLSGIEGAEITYIPAASSGISNLGLIGLGLLGGGLLLSAAGGGGGGGGDGSSSAASATATDTAGTGTSNSVSGSIVAGPLIAGHGLTVKLYKADGTTLLGVTGIVDRTGHFSIDVGSYTGAVIARVFDANSGVDFVDEATGLDKDLNANLMAVAVVSGGVTTLNINPLTTIAAIRAGLAADGSGSVSSASILEANMAVAAAFGVDNIVATHPVPTVSLTGSTSVSYIPDDGLNAGEKYGAVLAALSGSDSNNGGDTQTTINEFAASITGTGGNAKLNSTGLLALINGASTADPTTRGDLAGIFDPPPVLSISASGGIAKNEGSNLLSGSTFSFTVSRSHANGESTVDYVVNGVVDAFGRHGADAGDFGSGTVPLLPSGTVTFANGETSKTISISVAGDTVTERDETFSVTLLNPTSAILNITSSVQATILNDDVATLTADQIFASQGESTSHDTSAGFIRVMADFSKAAYDLQPWELSTTAGRAINDPSPLADQALAAVLLQGWAPLNLNPILPTLQNSSELFVIKDDVDGVYKPIDNVMASVVNRMDSGFFTNGNAAALVMRSDDALVISFRGTNDNKAPFPTGNPRDASNSIHLDADQWGKPNDFSTSADMMVHYDLFAPLFAEVDDYLGLPENAGLKVYVTGHSLGGAMAVRYMSDHPNNTAYRSATFAAPAFTVNDVGGTFSFDPDSRLTQIELNEDPVPQGTWLQHGRPGQTLTFAGNNTEDEPDGYAPIGNFNEDNHTMDYYRQITKSVDADSWKAIIDPQIGDQTIVIGAASGPNYFTPISNRAVAGNFDISFRVDGRETNTETRTINATVLDNASADDTLSSGFANTHSYSIYYGGLGSDTLTGGNFDELFLGGEGDDVINAGIGADRLNGGAGADEFIFSKYDSPIVVFNADTGTYKFRDGKAEIIVGGSFDTKGVNGDRITFAAPSLSSNLPFARIITPINGRVGDDQYFLDRGTFNRVDVFTRDSNGLDTLVVYDSFDAISIGQAAFVIQDVIPNRLSTTRLSTGESVIYYDVDTTVPAVTITNTTSGTATGQIVYGFTFSEAVTGFTIDDIVLSAGTKAGLIATDDSHYTLTVTPPTGSGNLTVGVLAGAVTDASGNANIGTTSEPQAYAPADTSSPTVVITDDTAGTASGVVNYTLTFSEAVTGFDVSDVTLSAGTKGALSGSGAIYTLAVTPPALSSGTLSVDIAAGVATDAAGNLNLVATRNTQTYARESPQAGDAIISLGSAGQLIFPVQVEGNWYYHWDRSGDGTSRYDTAYHDTLDAIFNQDVNGVTGGGGNTNDIYRYGTINGIHLALPTANGSGWISGTAVALNTITENPTYDGLLAIWDSYNGAGTGGNVSGAPSGWQGGNSGYWSASGGSGIHNAFLMNGNVQNWADPIDLYVALQVLPNIPSDTTAPTVVITDDTTGTALGVVNYTFTFSEAVTGFDVTDVTLSAGTKGTLSGSGATYTLAITPPALSSGTLTVDIAAGVATDAAGNLNLVATRNTQTYGASSYHVGDAVINLGLSGQLIFPVNVDGKWYYYWDKNSSGGADFDDMSRPHFLFNKDVNGNINPAGGTTDTYRYGSINNVKLALPTANGGNDFPQGINAGQNGTTIDNSPVGEINATYDGLLAIWDAYNGTGTTASHFSGTNQHSGLIDGTPPGWKGWSGGVSPPYASATSMGSGHSRVFLANGYAEGNSIDSRSSYVALEVIPVDTANPVVVITNDMLGVARAPITYTFTFSEAVSGFTVDDVVLSAGSKAGLIATDASHYTLTVVPPTGSGDLTVGVLAGAVSDNAGNTNIGTVSTPQAYAPADTAAPTVTISNTVSGTANGPIVYGFTFSEAVTGFTEDDVMLSGGSKAGLIATDDSHYTLTVVPPAGSGDLTVGVLAGAVFDAAGNTNVGTISAPQAYAPAVTSHAGDATIDLGAYGNLIAPVQVEGNWYYFWDRSGDGTSSDSGTLNGGLDYTTHDVLNTIFSQDINGVTGGGGSTTDTYRYATLNSVHLALPTVGLAGNSSGAIPVGTAVDNGAQTNTRYDDLLAVWDANNGSGTGTNLNGTPVGWQESTYWSASLGTLGHTFVDITIGNYDSVYDRYNGYVALQVL